MTVNIKRVMLVAVLATVMVFALAGSAFATLTTGLIESPAGSMRVYKTVDLVPGDTLTINQEYGIKASYLLTNAANGQWLAWAYGTNYAGFTGSAANVIVYKNTGTASLRVTVQVDDSQYSNLRANVSYSVPANTTTFATAWQSYALPTVSVAPGRTYTCVLTSKPSIADTLNFRVNGIASGSASAKLGPVWSYTNTGTTAVTISVMDSIQWATLSAAQVSSIGSLAGTLYY